MGIGDFFKNLSEKEEIGKFTGLPKHLVEKQEENFLKRKFSKYPARNKDKLVLIDGTAGGWPSSFTLPPEFFSEMGKAINKNRGEQKIKYKIKPCIIVKFPKSFFLLKFRLRAKARFKSLR
ncbi:hypothetical protein [Desulfurobacterium atlanticum]|uniref:Uncharacterized protein n=1 Tax=Desulfurobacterium atlanticum TaxID=240169 RepID=A0A238YSI7_9BACT|nr:hypothetical protein [Desulfurobacterium atlanticum]SNR73563.1 hypothetical protein SAMN06265340_104124 [Desulfurobacterium atlanticum]